MKSRIYLMGIIGLVVSSLPVRGDIFNELSAAEQKQLVDHEIVVKSREVKSPWPELGLYRVLDPPPEVVWDLFTD
ncbi:MAG: hypothetical protein ACK5NG_03500 [Chthoniobacterales bacterium]